MYKGPEKITRAGLYGATKPKAKRQGTRSPLKDLARLQVDVRAEMVNGTLVFTAPIRTESESNMAEHHMAIYKRKKLQKDQMFWFWESAAKKLFDLRAPYHVKFTRIGCKRIDPGNIETAFKSVQDQLCRILGIDDGSDQISFSYDQIATGKREYAVRIEISST